MKNFFPLYKTLRSLVPKPKPTYLLGARWQLDPSLVSVRVLSYDGGIVARGFGQFAPVTVLLFHTTHDGALRHGAQRKTVTHGERSYNNNNNNK